MRRFLIVFATLVVCSAPTWADSVELDVNAWATITAPTTCPSCVEKIDVNFLWMNNALPTGYGQIVLGSLDVKSSGFLGTFSPIGPQGANLFYLGLFNNLVGGEFATDEIDLYYGTTTGVITPGRNSLTFDFWGCQTHACTTAYAESWIGAPSGAAPVIQEGSIVKPVTTVPDGDSSFLLSFCAFGAFALAWRWRRKESSAA